nr:MAG TPA: hypothetical protein [Caudoviricetes sp.]
MSPNTDLFISYIAERLVPRYNVIPLNVFLRVVILGQYLNKLFGIV